MNIEQKYQHALNVLQRLVAVYGMQTPEWAEARAIVDQERPLLPASLEQELKHVEQFGESVEDCTVCNGTGGEGECECRSCNGTGLQLTKLNVNLSEPTRNPYTGVVNAASRDAWDDGYNGRKRQYDLEAYNRCYSEGVAARIIDGKDKAGPVVSGLDRTTSGAIGQP